MTFVRRLGSPLSAAGVGVVLALAFVLVRPAVPDLEAALARQQAAAQGVGLTYWFDWFSGGAAPGQYSLLTPWLCSRLGAPLVGGLATAGVAPLLARAVRGLPNGAVAVWVGLLAAGLSMWSGRIPFALGTAFAVAAGLALRERRPSVALVTTALAVAASPLAGGMLVLGLFAVLVTMSAVRGLTAAMAGTGTAVLLALLFVFGSPGTEIFRPVTAMTVVGCALVLLLARPAAPVRLLIWLVIAAAPAMLLIPNGVGSNVARLPEVWLPALVVATATRRRLAMFAVLPALIASGIGTAHDLDVATQPAAQTAYYDGLLRQLGRMPQLRNHRLEVVQRRSFHTASAVLVGHVAQPTGWETQAQNELDPVLTSPALNAATYRRWLADNAVGFIALDRRSPDLTDPEYRLAAARPPYLTAVWHDATWTIFRVADARPIVAPPARLITTSPAALTLGFAAPGAAHVRVRWSEFLELVDTRAGGNGAVQPAPDGWTTVTVPAAGTYELRGRA
jgi:hypothetical protein